jgi:uncharacterized protein involved in outer membrane biogenesis
MANRTKKILLITGVITIVAFACILALRFNINAFTPQIEAAVSTALGMDARIKGKLDVSLFPGFGLSLNDVSLRKNGLDVATIEKVKIELKLIALARFEIETIQIGLYKPVISIRRSAEGLMNLPVGAPWESLLAVKKIFVFQGNLVYAANASGEKIEAGDIDLSIKLNMPGGTNSAEPFKMIKLTGDIRCKMLRIKNVALMNLVMSANGEKGIFDINPFGMNIAGGTGSGSIHVDLTGTSPQYRLIGNLDIVRIEELLDLYGLNKIPRNTIEGSINFSADREGKYF